MSEEITVGSASRLVTNVPSQGASVGHIEARSVEYRNAQEPAR